MSEVEIPADTGLPEGDAADLPDLPLLQFSNIPAPDVLPVNRSLPVSSVPLGLSLTPDADPDPPEVEPTSPQRLATDEPDTATVLADALTVVLGEKLRIALAEHTLKPKRPGISH